MKRNDSEQMKNRPGISYEELPETAKKKVEKIKKEMKSDIVIFIAFPFCFSVIVSVMNAKDRIKAPGNIICMVLAAVILVFASMGILSTIRDIRAFKNKTGKVYARSDVKITRIRGMGRFDGESYDPICCLCEDGDHLITRDTYYMLEKQQVENGKRADDPFDTPLRAELYAYVGEKGNEYIPLGEVVEKEMAV